MTSCGIRNILVQYTEFREISEFRGILTVKLREIPMRFRVRNSVIPRFPSGVKNTIIKLLQKLYCMEEEA